MNILYINTHDTGRAISPYGYKTPTPNYQAFFEDSVLFNQVYCTAPTCSPSRSGLLTGTYPHQNGMLGLAHRGFKIKSELHLANLLKSNGFHTVLSGVQHEIKGNTEELGYQENVSAEQKKNEDKIIWDAANANNLSDWLDNYQSDEPFFASYGMLATHRPYADTIDGDIDPTYVQMPFDVFNNAANREDFAKYQTSLKKADENLKTVLDALKRNNLYDKTIIIVTTDHGLAYPFEKCYMKDSGIGVLFGMRVPGSKYAKKNYEGLLSQVDVMPTLCDLVGVEKPDYLEGQSFSKLFDGEEIPGDDAIYAEINFHTSYEPVRAVRTERFKYIRYFDKDYMKINRSNTDESSAMAFYLEHGISEITKSEEYLYDLYYDANENCNLVADERYQEQLEDLRNKLKTHMEATHDCLLDGPIAVEKGWRVNKKECIVGNSSDPDQYV